MSNRIVTYHYTFTFSNGQERGFEVKLDNTTLNLIQPKNASNPDWTKLHYHKCPNCSLKEEDNEFCPAATSLVDLVEFFSASMSIEEVDVLIESQERRYSKHLALQDGLSPLIGIYMTTSGCPVMEKFKPMVRHHLPFSTVEETKFRVLSMYLLAQYFVSKRGGDPDWNLKKLVKIYDEILIVNKNFTKRLATLDIEDASFNALTILNCFANILKSSLDKKKLDDLELLFCAYF